MATDANFTLQKLTDMPEKQKNSKKKDYCANYDYRCSEEGGEFDTEEDSGSEFEENGARKEESRKVRDNSPIRRAELER